MVTTTPPRWSWRASPPRRPTRPSPSTPQPPAAPPTLHVAHPSFGVAATSSSGLSVAIVASGAGSGSGAAAATIPMTSGTGTATVHYNQAGDDNYNAAPEVTETVTAQKANQTITV